MLSANDTETGTQTSQKKACKQQCATAQAPAGSRGGRLMTHFSLISGGQTDTGVSFAPSN